MHRVLGTLVSQRLPKKLLPEPDSSQKMSGLLGPKWLPITELFMGFGCSFEVRVRRDYDRDRGGARGDVAREVVARKLHATRRARSAMPIPEAFLSNFAARHERVLSSTVLLTSKPTTCSSNWSASKNMPAQLLRIVFAAMEPPLVTSPTYMPHAPPEMLLPMTLASLLARPARCPYHRERLMSLERILVPVEDTVPLKVVSLMSLEMILVSVDFSTSMPRLLSVRSLLEMVALVPSR